MSEVPRERGRPRFPDPASSGRTPPLVKMRDIRKSFGPTEVLHGVDFDVLPGEVHVLAGENGAGKSTLIKILSGAYEEYSGEVWLAGQLHRFHQPSQAAEAGIATIHQELSLVPTMSVSDNLFLGRERSAGLGRVDFRGQESHATSVLEETELDYPPGALVEDLPIAAQQTLEIARALARDSSVVVFDEPTSALGEHEVEALFKRIQELRGRGRGIVYITHKMEEIYRLADRITVLRDGEVVGSAPALELPAEDLVRLMVGRELPGPTREGAAEATIAEAEVLAEGADPTEAKAEVMAAAADSNHAGTTAMDGAPVTAGSDTLVSPSESLLGVQDLRVVHPGIRGRWVVDGVSFSLRPGEILGLAGLQGSGASEVLHALFGALPDRASGAATLCGQPLPLRHPPASIGRGLALLTNDRKAQGLAPDMSVTHSVSLSSLVRFSNRLGWVERQREASEVTGLTADFRLNAPSLDAPVRTLSGGNQQKVYLARCLMTKPRVLLLDEPTRGIDVGAKADIYTLIQDWVEEGIGILLITSEMDELLALSHRILVMYKGKVVSELRKDEATKDRILAAAMGVDTRTHNDRRRDGTDFLTDTPTRAPGEAP